ncbi:MAG: hypothetical protein ACKOCH_24980, partial [Bacteroidota bacterium]
MHVNGSGFRGFVTDYARALQKYATGTHSIPSIALHLTCMIVNSILTGFFKLDGGAMFGVVPR